MQLSPEQHVGQKDVLHVFIVSYWVDNKINTKLLQKQFKFSIEIRLSYSYSAVMHAIPNSNFFAFDANKQTCCYKKKSICIYQTTLSDNI